MYFVFANGTVGSVVPRGNDLERDICELTKMYPDVIYFEADLCAPVDNNEMFVLERTRLAQLVAAERSGFVNAEPMSDDFDTADKLLVVIDHETNEFVKTH